MNENEMKKKEFEEIAFQYMDSLYSLALKMARNNSDAQDLVQDAYLKAYRFFDKFEKGTNFKAWLFRILKNAYINKCRRTARQPQRVTLSELDEYDYPQDDVSPEDQIFDGLIGDEVTAAIDQLPEEFRLTIILSDLRGFSYKEVADMLNRPLGTVMSRLYRGRRLLRESLRDYAAEFGYAVAS